MKTRLFLAVFSMLMVFVLWNRAGAELVAGMSASGAEDRSGVEVTIYNRNLGLVKDQRTVRLGAGVQELMFMDVAAKIIPESVNIRPLESPETFTVLEQNYEYDLLNPQKLLNKYVGKKVRLYTKNPYTNTEEIVEATLLSNNGGPVYKIGEQITFGHPGRVIFPGVPENLISKPTLVWLLENRNAGPREVVASYLTAGINWKSDYVLTLDDLDKSASLSGWVTIDNKSGAAYTDAKLKLVAGDINRVRDEMRYERGILDSFVGGAAPARGFKEQEFFEYHVYTLQRPSTIKDNQKKQISLLGADNVPVHKEFRYYGAQHFYRSRLGRVISNQKVGVFLEIINSRKNNLGMPLPKGTVRVYKHDSEGSLQFVGEDSIDHTPRDEKIKIKMGNAFDVVAQRRQTDWEKLSSNLYEAAFEVTIRNHKKEDIAIKVIEPIPGDWNMLTFSHDYKKADAFTAEFTVPVKADEESKLVYRVRMKF